jgi:Na+-transporting NADH:ubiquinone oxidoreductase subunit A
LALHRNRKGLDLPIAGAPEPTVDTARQPRRVALLGADYVGMKPTMHVQVGDAVRRGQLVFEDKKTPGVRYTAPAEGKVVAVNRGDKRAFQSLVIEVSQLELGGRAGAEQTFSAYTGRSVESLTPEQIRDLLLEAGEWPALRSRPFGKVASPDTRPHSIFVTAMDTNPLAPPVAPIVADRQAELRDGLIALTKLTDGTVYVCTEAGSGIDVPDHQQIQVEQFEGPHPSGTAGWHIHTLDPVHRDKSVWYVGLQNLIAIGHLVRSGSLMIDRLIAVGGPGVLRPRLLRTRVGAGIDELLSGETHEGDARVISGSVLSGREASGEIHGYLGRYHQQVAVLPRGDEREFLGWLGPGLSKYSVVPTFLSKLMPGKKFDMTTSTNGSHRAIIPIGVYEKVFPFDLPPTQLLRSISANDIEAAEELGCLELDEEDMGLCTFVDPGKNDFGPLLREVLTTLEKEG